MPVEYPKDQQSEEVPANEEVVGKPQPPQSVLAKKAPDQQAAHGEKVDSAGETPHPADLDPPQASDHPERNPLAGLHGHDPRAEADKLKLPQQDKAAKGEAPTPATETEVIPPPDSGSAVQPAPKDEDKDKGSKK